MKRHITIASHLIFFTLAASLTLPVPVFAASVALATAPLATSSTTTVKPNLLFVLDNSGSMSFSFLPDLATNFQNKYGYLSSHCNAIYYNPAITYSPPVDATNVAYPNATFTAARDSGFDTTTIARDLNTAFISNRFEPAAANSTYSGSGSYLGSNSLGPYGAIYYQYGGSVTDLNYSNTSSPFYTECNTSIGSATTVFTKRTLASNEAASVTILTSVGPTATITVSGSSSTTVSSITVNGTTITSGTSSGSNSSSTTASNIAAKITAGGYNATASGSTVTITGPAGAAVFTPVITKSGTMTITPTAFNNPTVSSITVNGTELMSSSATTSTSTSTTAASIAAKITLSSYTATASGSTITISGPASAANYIPIITGSGITYTTDVFPDTTPANLTNFANWYSYYRTRMQMMKTSAGRAFSNLDASYRVGLMKINSSSTPVVEVAPFETTQRSNWYSTFYSIIPNSSTPLREALSNAGRYYAGKLSATDPIQYSCQQNFTILSTDGYWNGNDGFTLDGSTAVGNQDTAVARPMYDGTVTTNQWTFTYTRDSYSKTNSSCSSGKKLKTQPEIGSCINNASTGSCTPTSWSNNGSSTTSGSCNTTPAPSPSAPVLQSVVQNTPLTSGGASDTLADVAMYYYQTDLRTPALSNCGTIVSPATVGPLCDNNVFISPTDNNTQQHMTTFTLGLGGSGRMNYSNSYLTDATGDYVSVKLGSVAHPTATPPVCSWQADGTTCNWPTPGADQVENIDDMWHAAVNGRGAYFSATDPTSLSDGLSSALASVNARKGAAAAAATSSLNPVAGNNSAYFASYTTVDWRGNLESRSINTDTGVISENASWCVENVTAGTCATAPVAQTSGDTTIYNCETPSTVVCNGGVLGYSGDTTSGTMYCKVPVAVSCTGTMNSKVAALTDTRTIKTASSDGASLINFDNTYATANPSYFNAAHISTLSQWTSLTIAQQTAATANLVNYLRGQNGYEDRSANSGPPDNRLYRYRQSVLGDALESQPNFISKAVFSYPYPGYSDYVTAQASRTGTVYLGANDGMLHAFASDTGIERWAYVPSMVIPNMWKLADQNYATLHQNFVNGSPIISDVCTANCTDSATAVWKTILVGGLGGGGRGFYALDITVPSTPVLLWELTPTTGIGKVKDDDIGYSYGNPVITRKTDGTWVVLVTSGYNNTGPGNGNGYLYVLNAGTGAIISKISTGVGSTTTPSGLAKVAGFNIEPAGNAVGFVYGGDLLGNVWRFNINGPTTATIGFGDVVKFATLFSDAAGTNPQAITTTPVLGVVAGSNIVFIGTGKYLETGDLPTTQIQTQYAIKDDNSGTLVNPRTTLVQQMLTNNPDGTATRLASSNVVNFYTGRGWYVNFPESKERVNIDSTLVQGALIIPTIVPSNTACSPGGHGWLNFLDYRTGGALSSTGLASYRYDTTIVGGNVLFIDGSPLFVPITSDGKIQKPPDIPFPPATGSFTGKRTLWRELIQ